MVKIDGTGTVIVGTDNPMPPALAPVLRDLSEHQKIVRMAVNASTPAALNWRPRDGGWSVLQCIQHLTQTNQTLRDALARSVREAAPDNAVSDRLALGWVWRRLIAIVEPPSRFRGRAPAALQPSGTLEPTATADAFEAVHQDFFILAQQCGGLDLNRKRLRHPILRLRMSIGALFVLTAAHERRHLAQAQRVTDAYSRQAPTPLCPVDSERL